MGTGAILAGVIGAAGAIGSGVIASNAAKKAANTQVQAAEKATNVQQGMYNQTRNDLMPYNMAGQSAIGQLMSYWGLGQGNGQPTAGSASNAFEMLQNYPGYQFQYNQGLEALNRSHAAGGRFTSGAQMKDAQAYGQGMAQSSVQNYLQMLQYLGSTGQNAAAQTGSIGSTTGANIGQTMMSGGSAAASGQIGAANALTNSLQGLMYQTQPLFGGAGTSMGTPASFNPQTGNWNPGPGGFQNYQY